MDSGGHSRGRLPSGRYSPNTYTCTKKGRGQLHPQHTPTYQHPKVDNIGRKRATLEWWNWFWMEMSSLSHRSAPVMWNVSWVDSSIPSSKKWLELEQVRRRDGYSVALRAWNWPESLCLTTWDPENKCVLDKLRKWFVFSIVFTWKLF